MQTTLRFLKKKINFISKVADEKIEQVTQMVMLPRPKKKKVMLRVLISYEQFSLKKNKNKIQARLFELVTISGQSWWVWVRFSFSV